MLLEEVHALSPDTEADYRLRPLDISYCIKSAPCHSLIYFCLKRCLIHWLSQNDFFFLNVPLLVEEWPNIVCSICMYRYKREKFAFLGVCSFAHFRFDLVTCWRFVLGRHLISRQTSRHTRLSLQPEQWQIILIMIRVLLKVFALPKPGDATRAETITEGQRITFRKTKVKEENFV